MRPVSKRGLAPGAQRLKPSSDRRRPLARSRPRPGLRYLAPAGLTNAFSKRGVAYVTGNEAVKNQWPLAKALRRKKAQGRNLLYSLRSMATSRLGVRLFASRRIFSQFHATRCTRHRRVAASTLPQNEGCGRRSPNARISPLAGLKAPVGLLPVRSVLHAAEVLLHASTGHSRRGHRRRQGLNRPWWTPEVRLAVRPCPPRVTALCILAGGRGVLRAAAPRLTATKFAC